MHLYVIAFGTLKSPGMREAMDHYLMRLSHFHKVHEIELKASQDTVDNVIQLEKSLAKLGNPVSVNILDESGSNHTTKAWSERLNQHNVQGTKSAVYVIGPAYGFGSHYLNRKGLVKISLGSQTLPHELARVVLTEQLYRAACLLQNHPYHHE